MTTRSRLLLLVGGVFLAMSTLAGEDAGPGPGSPIRGHGLAVPDVGVAPDRVGQGAGGMFVRDIHFRSPGPHLEVTVTVYQDADRDGVGEFYDDPVAQATVSLRLRRDSNGDGTFACGTDECRSFTGTTGWDGEVEFRRESARAGDYEAEVTGLVHESFVWDRDVETADRAYVTLP